jgi:hypothetical protein
MLKTLMMAATLAATAATAPAADDPRCARRREVVLELAVNHDCAAEEAEATATSCKDAGRKEWDRLYEMVQTCDAKPELPAGIQTCRGLDGEGKVIAMARSNTSQEECLRELKAKTAKLRCDGKAPTVEFSHQWRKWPAPWTKGEPSSASCK